MSTLEELLEGTKDEKRYNIIYLLPEETGEKFLLEAAIERAEQTLAGQVTFQRIDGLAANQIKSQLKIKNLPVLLLVREGQLESIYNGMIGSRQLITIISQLFAKEKNPLRA